MTEDKICEEGPGPTAGYESQGSDISKSLGNLDLKAQNVPEI